MSLRKKVYGFLALATVAALVGYFAPQFFNPDGIVSRADSSDPETPGVVEEKEDEAELIPVETVAARTGAISHFITSTANLRPQREVSVASQTEGVVRNVTAEEGDYVRKSQLLCKLDDTQLQIRLQSARQKLAQAKLQLEKARILSEKSNVQVENTGDELERYQKLYEESLVSEKEVAEVRYRMDDLQHDQRVTTSESRELTHKVEELEAEIREAELEISRTRIEAPFSGFITERTVDLGQAVKNLDPLFQLGDFSPLLAEVFLSERDASEIVVGQFGTVRSGVDPSVTVPAKVSRISPIVDDATGTVKITIELGQSQNLFKPGAFVRVEIRTDTREDSVLVPKRSVVEEDQEKFVFVADEDSVRRVLVEVGYESNGDVEILEGLTAGDAVVVAGQGGLKEGSKIKLVENTEAS